MTMSTTEIAWVTVGAIGQALFMARMIVQWWVSEKQKQSVVPISFWYLSVGGSVLMFAYAVYRVDPVFIAGQALGMIVYFRNIALIKSPAAEKTAENVISLTVHHDDDASVNPSLITPSTLRTSTCTCPCTCKASLPTARAA